MISANPEAASPVPEHRQNAVILEEPVPEFLILPACADLAEPRIPLVIVSCEPQTSIRVLKELLNRTGLDSAESCPPQGPSISGFHQLGRAVDRAEPDRAPMVLKEGVNLPLISESL